MPKMNSRGAAVFFYKTSGPTSHDLLNQRLNGYVLEKKKKMGLANYFKQFLCGCRRSFDCVDIASF